MVLGNHLWVTLLEQGGLTRYLHRSLPTSTTLMWSTSSVFTDSLQGVHVFVRKRWVPVSNSLILARARIIREEWQSLFNSSG